MAQNLSGEGPSWTDFFWSWTIQSQLDKFQREREVTGSVENGGKWLRFSLILPNIWDFIKNLVINREGSLQKTGILSTKRG